MVIKNKSIRDYLLLTTQKNTILECIRDAGLVPLNFELVEENTEHAHQGEKVFLVSVFRYLNSDFYFKFERDTFDKYYYKSHPSIRYIDDALKSKKYDWEYALSHFREWLSRLKEQEVPDLWEQLKTYTPDEVDMGKGEIPNVKFSYIEVENIIQSLDKLEIQIEKNFSLQGDQSTFISKQIDYLKEAAKRQGRKDWMHTSIGVMITIAMGLALSPDKTKILWDLVKVCFSMILPLPAP